MMGHASPALPSPATRIIRGLNEIRRQQKRRSPNTWQGVSGLWRSMNSTFKERLMELYHRRRAACARHG